MGKQFSGVLVPVLTPFDDNLNPRASQFVEFCEALLSGGASGLALFGTTSEANSMSADERIELLEAVRDAGLSGQKLMPGIGSCSITETSRLLLHAADCGAAAALMLPPFYYKSAAATDDGLFEFFASVMRRTEGCPTKIFLYHIPPIAHVGWSVPLVGRLLDAFGDRITGIKDSSGEWENTAELIESFPQLDVFPGSEAFLLRGLRAGGCGCITATANINLAGVRRVYDGRDSDDADSLQQHATAVRQVIQSTGHPIAVMKSYLAFLTGDDDWARVRPPLCPVGIPAIKQMHQQLCDLGFRFDLSISHPKTI